MSTTILTDEQIEQGREATFSTNNPYCPCDSKTMRKAARWAEQAVLQSAEVQAWKRDAERYRWLRSRDLDTIAAGGVFAGRTPDNVVLNVADLDAAIEEQL